MLAGLKVALTAEEETLATVSAKVTVRCPRKRARAFSLRSSSVKLAKGAQRSVVLKASKATKRRLRGALACKGAKASANVKIAMTDSARNTAQVSRSASVR